MSEVVLAAHGDGLLATDLRLGLNAVDWELPGRGLNDKRWFMGPLPDVLRTRKQR